MKKSVVLKIDGNEEFIIGYDKNTMVSFQIGYRPGREKGTQSEYSCGPFGFEWGDKNYSLSFDKKEIKEGQKIELEFGVFKTPTIEPIKKIVIDEKRCSFCNKKSCDVQTLIEHNAFHRICNECVQECLKVIDEQNA